MVALRYAFNAMVNACFGTTSETGTYKKNLPEEDGVLKLFTYPRGHLLLLILFCLLLAANLVQAAPFQGKVVKSQGQVQVFDAEGKALSLVDTNNIVLEEQTITTGANGRAVVSFNNGSITVLDKNSRLQIRTPNWFMHLAGKAYFTFKKIVGGEEERKVQSTVALIGIRGTTFMSYEGAQQAVALKEGLLNLGALEKEFNLVKDGSEQAVKDFNLDANRMVRFDGVTVTESNLTRAILADFAAFEAFGGSALTDFIDDYTPDIEAGSEGDSGDSGQEKDEEQDQDADAADEKDDDGLGWYVGLGGGVAHSDSGENALRSDLEGEGRFVDAIDFDDKSNTSKVFVGYHLTNFFAVEGGFVNLGEFTSEIDPGSETDLSGLADDVIGVHPVSAEGFTAAAVFRLNLPILSLHAKAGLIAWDGRVEADFPVSSSVDTDKSGTDAFVGVGVNYHINKNFSIRVEAEHYELDDTKIDTGTVSGVYWLR